jgi:flagellar biosynthesis protein FlhA
MQELLAEGVPVRNMRTIAETLAEHAAQSQDPAVLLGQVREALGTSIVQRIYGLRAELNVITLDPKLEQLLGESLKNAQGGAPSFEPALADKLHQALVAVAQQQQTRGDPAVLLVSGPLRPWLARLTRFSVPNLHVLAYGEIPHDKSLRVASTVGGN